MNLVYHTVRLLSSKTSVNFPESGILSMASVHTNPKETEVFFVKVFEGSLTGDKRKIYQAICYDPLTASVLSLREIEAMVNEMFAANEAYLPQFK